MDFDASFLARVVQGEGLFHNDIINDQIALPQVLGPAVNDRLHQGPCGQKVHPQQAIEGIVSTGRQPLGHSPSILLAIQQDQPCNVEDHQGEGQGRQNYGQAQCQ